MNQKRWFQFGSGAIGCAFLLLICAPLNSQTKAVASDLRGNDLLRYCTSDDADYKNFCTGYLEGVRDGVIFATVRSKAPFAIPIDVDSEQVRDVVVKYLNAHPETRHKPAGMLVIFALRDAFPPTQA